MIPSGVDSLLAEAERHYAAGRREEARAGYAEALRQAPGHPMALHALGWLAHESGDNAAAEKWIGEAIAADPKSPGFHNSLGVVRLSRGDAAGAEAAFLLLTELRPDDPRGYLNLGHARRRLGRAAEAASAYQNAARLAPGWLDAHLAAGAALNEAGDFNAAAAAFSRALGLRPDRAPLHQELALTLLKAGRPDDAIVSLRNAIIFDPSYAPAYCNLGLALEGRGDSAGALRALREAQRLEPGSGFIAYHLAAVAATAGRGTPSPPICPPQYLLELFDNYADRFDKHLVQDLGYVGPQLLFEIVTAAQSSVPSTSSGQALSPQSSVSWDILDLGCGTGLTGVPFAPWARSLVGVDLSRKMLDRCALRRTATGKPLYDRLLCSDLVTALREGTQYDLILAADVFIYIGDLREIFAAAAQALRPGGLFAFTIEVLAEGAPDYRVLVTRRYAQSAAYIERLTREHGFQEVSRRSAALRQGDDGLPVEGMVFLLRNAR